MAQAFSCRPLATEASLHLRAIRVGFSGGGRGSAVARMYAISTKRGSFQRHEGASKLRRVVVTRL